MGKEKLSYAGLLLLCAVIIWGTTHKFGKIAMRELDLYIFAVLRNIFTVPILLLVLTLTEKGLYFKKENTLPFAVLDILGHFLNRFSWSYGLNFTTATNASLLIKIMR